jgi:ureidoacrylate peracid hydrolase
MEIDMEREATQAGSADDVSQRGSDQTYLAKDQPAASFPRNRTVLLVIDPVNDFLSEGGAGWEMTKNTVRMHDVIGHLKQAIEGARERGVPVLFAPMAYTEEDYADEKLQRRSGINRIMFEKRMFLAGSWGADFHPDLRPLDDEIVVLPHKGVDVFETDLPQHLERLGTTHLVIAGMTANLCCESTGRRAMEAGYDVTYLSDAIGAENMIAYEASIRVNYPLVANAVMEAAEFLAALDASAGATTAAQPGDTVRGSDHGDIGTVKQLVAATPDIEAHLVVSQGMLRDDLYIPAEAVVNRAGNELFVNVPKLVVGSMPWQQPPRREDQKQKQGPNASEVNKLYGSRAPSSMERA